MTIGSISMTIMNRDLERLLKITDGCRPDMHEPDEQHLTLVAVVGDHLDNACGERISERAIAGGYQEAVIVLRRLSEPDGKPTEQVEAFNLANLIALARRAPMENV